MGRDTYTGSEWKALAQVKERRYNSQRKEFNLRRNNYIPPYIGTKSQAKENG